MNSVEDLSAFLPKYLSDANYRTLLKELDAFPYNIDKRMYTTFLDNDILYQGDGYHYFPVVDLAHLEKGSKNVSGIILSNTCDMDLSNLRYYPSSIMFAPIVSLENYVRTLKLREITDEQIKNHLSDIRKQHVSSIFYLPEDAKVPESLVFLDKMNNIQSSFIDRKTLDEHRLFSLSDYGFYLLLFKLSVHFSRIREGVNRGQK